MAITTYSELKTAIADFLNRDDLTSSIPTFISLAEAQLRRDIRHYEMEASTALSVSSQYTDRPADWLETIRLYISGSKRSLDLLSIQGMADKRQGSEDATGIPRYYAHIDGSFEVFPTPDGTYSVELMYFKKIPALSDSNTSNWLLQNYPDVYLYGALIHSSPYLQEDARVGVWAQLYSAAALKVNQESDKAKYSGSGLTMKVHGLG
jgi:hypothetical protein